MLKKTILILISLVIIFSMTGSASATKPEPVYCEFVWLDSAGEFMFFPVEGKMTYNETAQVYNISCRYKFDFDSGEWVDLATVCSFYPDDCNPNQSMFRITGWGWPNAFEYLTQDTTYQVNANGQAKFFAQYAPEQCANEYKALNYTYIPLEEWTPGLHTYQFIEEITDWSIWYSDPIEFTVDENAALLDSNVRLGIYFISDYEGLLDPYTINPEQETFAQITWWTIDKWELEWLRDFVTYKLVIDGGDPVDLLPGPIVNFCSVVNDGSFEREWGYVR